MPADIIGKVSSSPIAAVPASTNSTPEKPKSASEHRKSSKPIMEKRRRARINESLCQLKGLILDAVKKDTSRHSKLEKADILEMTVKYLRNMHRQQLGGLGADPWHGKFRAGFSDCMNEVTRFLSTCEGVNTEVRTRLLAHLATHVSQMSAVSQSTQHHISCPAAPVVQVGSASSQRISVPHKATTVPDVAKFCSGFQIVPTTDGKFAFLIPNASIVNVCTQRNTPLPPSISSNAQLGTLDSVWRPW